MRILFAIAVLIPASTVVAQGMSVSVISPRGAEFFEGNSASNIMLGNFAANTRVQQIDNNLVGMNMPLIRFLGWRRDGTGNAGAAKTTDLTITMSHADYNLVTSTFAANYKDPPQVVFSRKPVNLPDWNTPVAVVPSPIDAIVPLDFPFVYNGVDAVLWDVQNESNPLGEYRQDWVSRTVHTYGDFPRDTGPGCMTANGTMNHRMALRANATTFEMGFVVNAAPASTPVSLLLGVQPANIPVPGLCVSIMTQPLMTVALGASNASGDIPLFFPISIPWQSNFAGVPFHTQAFAADPGQPQIPLAMSNGLSTRSPVSAGPGSINVKRIYHTSSATATSGVGPSVSAVVTLYGY